MRHIIIFILAVLMCTMLPQSPVQGQQSEGSVLFVAPHRLIVKPDETVGVLNVSNKSDKPRRYDLTIVDQVMDTTGVTQRKDTFEYSAKRMAKFVPKRFTLEPGGRQTVRVMITRPADLKDGDYHSHLLFREVPLSTKDKKQLEAERKDAGQGVSFEIRTLYGIGVPMIVQHGKVEEDIELGEAKVRTGEGGKTLEIAFRRLGNSEAAGKLSVDYVGAGKEPVAVIDPQWVRIYREVDAITKTFSLNLPEDAAGGKLVITLVKDETDPAGTVSKEITF